MSTPQEGQEIRTDIALAADIGGAVAGTGAGLLLGGPVGALVGGTLGPVVSKALEHVMSRVYVRLHEDARRRVDITAQSAIQLIGKHIQEGDKVRDDDFFDGDNPRSAAVEIFEGCLLRSRDSQEEKKARYLGELFANIAFASGVKRAEANHWVFLAGRMTYLQLVLLSLYERLAPTNPLRRFPYQKDDAVQWETISMLQEIFELCQAGLMYREREKGSTGSGKVLFTMNDVLPAQMRITEQGRRLSALMGLDQIPEEDIQLAVEKLK